MDPLKKNQYSFDMSETAVFKTNSAPLSYMRFVLVSQKERRRWQWKSDSHLGFAQKNFTF
jgi:hypothetical protein